MTGVELSAAEKAARLERKARELYEIWKHRACGYFAFDHLPNREREAWFELADALLDHASCKRCDGPLFCRACAERL